VFFVGEFLVGFQVVYQKRFFGILQGVSTLIEQLEEINSPKTHNDNNAVGSDISEYLTYLNRKTTINRSV